MLQQGDDSFHSYKHCQPQEIVLFYRSGIPLQWQQKEGLRYVQYKDHKHHFFCP